MRSRLIAALMAVVMCAMLVSCGGESDVSGFYEVKVKGCKTVGLIKDFDKNDEADIIKRTVLKKHLPNMSGDVAFAAVHIYGEDNGKTYAQIFYESYELFDRGYEIKSMGFELAAFENVKSTDYTVLSEGLDVAEWDGYELLPPGLIPDESNMIGCDGYGTVHFIYYFSKALTEEEYAESEAYFMQTIYKRRL